MRIRIHVANSYMCHEYFVKISHTRIFCNVHIGLYTIFFDEIKKNLGESWSAIQEGYEFVYMPIHQKSKLLYMIDMGISIPKNTM